MKVWKVIAIVGAVVIVLSLAFLFASSTIIGSAITSAINRMHSMPPISINPSNNVTVNVKSLSYFLYNSSSPLKLIQDNKTIAQFEIENFTWIAIISPNTNLFIINNYTTPMIIKYTTEAVTSTIYLVALAPYLLFLGIFILIIAFVFFIFSRKR
ncbi:MAG: hypothetical protein OWQ54_05330 [Sulfolobaceae archaeon]|nr:hypothetical protein [Sulfolobaceae archaeon]